MASTYSQVPLERGPIYEDISYGTAITVTESESDFRITTDTPYLALTDELWGVYCEDIGENWPCYNGTALYFFLNIPASPSYGCNQNMLVNN